MLAAEAAFVSQVLLKIKGLHQTNPDRIASTGPKIGTLPCETIQSKRNTAESRRAGTGKSRLLHFVSRRAGTAPRLSPVYLQAHNPTTRTLIPVTPGPNLCDFMGGLDSYFPQAENGNNCTREDLLALHFALPAAGILHNHRADKNRPPSSVTHLTARDDTHLRQNVKSFFVSRQFFCLITVPL